MSQPEHDPTSEYIRLNHAFIQHCEELKGMPEGTEEREVQLMCINSLLDARLLLNIEPPVIMRSEH